MILFLILNFLIPSVFGWALFSATNTSTEKVTGLAAGIVSGLAIFTTTMYALTGILTISSFMIVIVLIVFLAVTVLLFTITPAWRNWWHLPIDWLAVNVWLITLIIFIIIGPKLLITKPDGLYTGIINAYGDIAWHMSNVTLLAVGQPIPPTDPIFAGTKLTYPFMSNFFSAILLKSGASFTQSVNVPAVILIPTFLVLLYALVRNLGQLSEQTSRLAKRAGIIAVILFLFGGATWGFYRIAGDFGATSQDIFTFLGHLPMRDYSGVGTDTQGFHFLNPVTTLLLPQRAFLFGLPLAVIIILLLLQATKERIAPFVVAGVLSGILPMFHAHTVIALIPIIITLFFFQPGIHWLIYFLVAGIVGVPEVLYFALNSAESGSFMRWGPGWMKPADTNFFWYWFKNTGFLVPVALLGFWLPLSRLLKALTIAAGVLFVAANLFLFAPWAWDNFKILVYWFLFTLPLVSYVAAYYIWRPQSKSSPKKILIALAIAFVVLQSTSAALDIWKLLLPTAQAYGEWDTSSIDFAQKVEQATKPTDTIVTAAYHNSPAVLAGRARYLGYAAHVWSHGGLPWNRENALKPFYQGILSQLPEFSPNYLIIGPVERRDYDPIVIRPEWQLVTSNDEYQLYKIK